MPAAERGQLVFVELYAPTVTLPAALVLPKRRSFADVIDETVLRSNLRNDSRTFSRLAESLTSSDGSEPKFCDAKRPPRT